LPAAGISCFNRDMNVHESIAPAGQIAATRFTGANGRFRRLVTRGALLELVTFGFYRFWLATDMRRYLWSSTEIDGDALEYNGRGKELLLGFLFAMAVLAPIFLLYFLVGLAFERFKAFSSVPLYIFFFLFGQFAVYRARRYRLTRTIWRGVRFWMTGSGWSYALRAMLWWLLVIPTLGFAYPWQMASLERYKMGHTFYGDLPGRFEATGWQLFKRVWWVWLLGLCPIIVILGGSMMAAVAGMHSGAAAAGSGVVIFLGALLCIALPFLHAVRKATEWRWWAEGIRFGGVAVGCVLPRGGLIGVYWAMIGMSLLVILGFALLGGGIVAVIFFNLGRAGFGAEMAHLPVWGFVGYGVWYLSMALTFGVVARIYTLQRIWQRVANACLLRNPGAAANVMAAGEAASALGEGLADGLDFAGF
jgi:uncharacterized membrane protein YjgN (DUF898 family)